MLIIYSYIYIYKTTDIRINRFTHVFLHGTCFLISSNNISPPRVNAIIAVFRIISFRCQIIPESKQKRPERNSARPGRFRDVIEVIQFSTCLQLSWKNLQLVAD
jgi:hypothetical protein